MDRLAITTAVVLASLAFGAPAAAGATVPVAIDEPAPSLESADDGGWTAALGFTNLTDERASLEVRAADAADKGCEPELDKSGIAAASHKAVTVTIPDACSLNDKDGFDFVVAATAGAASQSFEVSAAPTPDEDDPEWGALWAFVVGLGVSVIVLWGAYVYWERGDEEDRNPSTGLSELDSSWSFTDSWASNVTVAGALLTGIFGSADVVKAILGEDAEAAVALAIVGAAVAAAFVAAGPLILNAAKATSGPDIPVYGLWLAAAVTLAGAAGELHVVYRSAVQLDLGGWESQVIILWLIGLALLAWYGISGFLATLHDGTTPDPEPKPSDTLLAASMIVDALRAPPEADTEAGEVHALAQTFLQSRQAETVPPVPVKRRRRSALL